LRGEDVEQEKEALEDAGGASNAENKNGRAALKGGGSASRVTRKDSLGLFKHGALSVAVNSP